MLTRERIAEIQRLRDNATLGPWWFDEDDQCWRLHGVAGYIAASDPIPQQVINRQILKAPKCGTPYAEYWPDEDDAAFIAEAWTAVGELLAEVDRLAARVTDLEGERGQLRTENDGLFLSYSTEKSRREIASEAFEEVSAERDKLAEKVRELEFEREPRCRAMGPPSLCGDEGKPLGPCELPPGHRNAYHRDGHGWWLDDADKDAAAPGRAEGNEQ